ncbi:MAG: elongation factor G [Candidatus Marinimicrobia bacterium]|nr:elongation factor G [Candidatus Neomarinimicrobiota bacterium]
MKEFQGKDIRNFVIVGHGGCGKTMLSESMMMNGGELTRMGTIEAGNTLSDYHQGEQERQVSIHSTPMHLEWDEKKFNLIDAPGYLDFVGEALGALAVVDMALVTIHAVNGIEVGTDQMWSKTSEIGIPKLIIVNGLDREHTKFDEILTSAREHFGKNVFPMQLPVNSGPGFNQIVDVMRNEIVTYKTDGSGTYTEKPADGEWAEKVEALHEELIEYVAESDDSLLEKFFEEGTLSEDEMRGGIHAAIQNQTMIPLFCTAAASNVGVQRLMDFIAKYGSSPVDRAKVTAKDFVSEKDVDVKLENPETVIQVFKTISEAHVGELSFFRVYSGKVSTGMDLYNTTRSTSERFGQLFIINGKSRTNVQTLNAGDIGAVVKLKDTHTGNTLCSPKFKVLLPETNYPNPNTHTAILLKAKGDEEKISVGLSSMHEEDPSFVYRVDSEIKQTIISGQGELHLKIVLEQMKRRYGVEVDMIKPKVPYRETIRAKGESKYRHKKQSGGAGQFAEVWMRIEPKQRGEGVEFTDSLVGQNVDRVFVPSVEKGVNATCNEGILAGCRVVDLKVEFYDGKQHPVDSKDIAFQIAGKHAFREAFLAARPGLLEPIMNVEVRVPEDHMGDVMGDVSSRRGKIMGMDSEGNMQIIKAQIPQAELHQYATTIRSITGGRGLHSESFSHYDPMPKDHEKKVISNYKKEKEEE